MINLQELDIITFDVLIEGEEDYSSKELQEQFTDEFCLSDDDADLLTLAVLDYVRQHNENGFNEELFSDVLTLANDINLRME